MKTLQTEVDCFEKAIMDLQEVISDLDKHLLVAHSETDEGYTWVGSPNGKVGDRELTTSRSFHRSLHQLVSLRGKKMSELRRIERKKKAELERQKEALENKPSSEM